MGNEKTISINLELIHCTQDSCKDKQESVYYPHNLHILVIDDKIGDRGNFLDYNQYFDNKLKFELKKPCEANKTCKTFNVIGKVFIHYCKDPTKLEYIFRKKDVKKNDKKYDFPVDIILLDINFDRININDIEGLGYAFISKGKHKAGFQIYEYIKAYKKEAIDSIPIIVITGGNIEGSDEELKSLLGENYKDSNDFQQKENDQQKEKDWICRLAEKIKIKHKDYYKDQPLDTTKTNHLIHRISKEIYFFQRHDIQKDTFYKVEYPKYTLTLKSCLNGEQEEQTQDKHIIKGNFIADLNPSSETLSIENIEIPEQTGGEIKSIIENIIRKAEGEKEIQVFKNKNSSQKIFDDADKYYGEPKENNANNNTEILFGGKKFKNRLFLAATPLTAFSTKDNSPIESYINKLNHLYNLNIGGIILKTVYFEKEDLQKTRNGSTNKYDHIQEKSITRCYRTKQNNAKLFNTGKTSKENINSDELIELLNKVDEKENGFKKSIILSLGSHEYEDNIWKEFFNKIFKNNSDKSRFKSFNFIEINARHAMREISKKCCRNISDDKLNPFLYGVDEYFISPDISIYYGYWNIFEDWIENIHQLGIYYQKYLMLKLPFRSDLNILISIIRSTISKINKNNSNKDYGIRAISAINTIKSPYPAKNLPQYDHPNLPQISGAGLQDLRNITLFTLYNVCKGNNQYNNELDISASGGIMTKEDVEQCFRLGADTVQLSSAILLNGFNIIKSCIKEKTEIKPIIGEDSRIYFNNKNLKLLGKRTIKFYPQRCHHCGKCTNTFYCDAIVNKFIKGKIINNTYIPNSPIYKEENCSGCGLCASVCDHNALELEPTKAKKKCPICESNTEIFSLNGDFNHCNTCKTIYSPNGSNRTYNIFFLDKCILNININKKKKYAIKITKNHCLKNFKSFKIQEHNSKLTIETSIKHFVNCEINKDYEIQKIENSTSTLIEEQIFSAHHYKGRDNIKIILKRKNN